MKEQTWPCGYCNKQTNIAGGTYAKTSEKEKYGDQLIPVARWTCRGCAEFLELDHMSHEEIMRLVNERNS